MAISYRGGKVAGTAGQGGGSIAITDLTGGSGAAALAGDLVVVTVSVGTAARQPAIAIATPTGYTALSAQRTTASAVDANVQTCYKIMGGTPDTAVTIPASGNAADGIAYTIQVFAGVDTTTPMDVAATFATGSGTDSLPNPAAIQPTTAGAWIVVCGGGAAAAGAVYTAGYLTNFLTANGPDTNDGAVGSGYLTWTSGSYDPAAFGGGNVNAANSWGASTLALRPLITLSQIDGATTQTFSPVAALTGAGALGGVATLSISSTSPLTGAAPIAGSCAITFAGTNTLQGILAAVGSATITFGGSAGLTGAGALAGSAALSVMPGALLLEDSTPLLLEDGTALLLENAAAATLTGAGALVGSAASVFSGTLVLVGSGALAGATTLAFSSSVALAGAGALAGLSLIAFAPSGTLELPSGALSGTAAVSFSSVAALLGTGSLVGTAPLAFAPVAALGGAGVVAGACALVFANDAVLGGSGALAGSSELAWVGSGTLIAEGVSSEGSASLAFTVRGSLISVERIFMIHSENRVYRIQPENRMHMINAENRSRRIPAEDRVLRVA